MNDASFFARTFPRLKAASLSSLNTGKVARYGVPGGRMPKAMVAASRPLPPRTTGLRQLPSGWRAAIDQAAMPARPMSTMLNVTSDSFRVILASTIFADAYPVLRIGTFLSFSLLRQCQLTAHKIPSGIRNTNLGNINWLAELGEDLIPYLVRGHINQHNVWV